MSVQERAHSEGKKNREIRSVKQRVKQKSREFMLIDRADACASLYTRTYARMYIYTCVYHLEDTHERPSTYCPMNCHARQRKESRASIT